MVLSISISYGAEMKKLFLLLPLFIPAVPEYLKM